MLDFYHRICRPENAWLSVGGSIKPGEVEEFWVSKNEDWKPGKAPSAPYDRTPAMPILSTAGIEGAYELHGKEFPGNDPAIAQRLLAIIAIGSGKGSAMFERLREGRGWSYRQEAVLYPTANGFVPRLIMASGDKMAPIDLIKGMREELLDAVNAWTDADLARARGMAEGILLRGVEMSPLYFNSYWPVTTSLDDETFLSGYWLMKTGRQWDPNKLVGQMGLLTLSELKESALDIINGASSGFILASG